MYLTGPVRYLSLRYLLASLSSSLYHSSIHFLYPFNTTQGRRCLEPIPTVIEQEVGYTLVRSPVHDRATQRQTSKNKPCTLTLTLEVNLESTWKPECPERTHTYIGKTCKLYIEKPRSGFEPGTLLLWPPQVSLLCPKTKSFPTCPCTLSFHVYTMSHFVVCIYKLFATAIRIPVATVVNNNNNNNNNTFYL